MSKENTSNGNQLVINDQVYTLQRDAVSGAIRLYTGRREVSDFDRVRFPGWSGLSEAVAETIHNDSSDGDFMDEGDRRSVIAWVEGFVANTRTAEADPSLALPGDPVKAVKF